MRWLLLLLPVRPRLLVVACGAAVLLVSVAPAVARADTSYVTARTLNGAQRNNTSSWVGMRFSTTSALTVTQLGRYFIAGSTQTHTVKLVAVSTGTDVAGGSVSIDMAAGTADALGFKYATLASPVTLAPGTYYLASQEFSGGDKFYDNVGTTVSTTSVASELGSVYGTPWTANGSAGQTYGPVNFQYTTGTTLTGTHYVDNAAGCSNGFAGTSSAAPWCDFANVNSATFAAGAQLLLKRGDTWNVATSANNQLNLAGTGTAASPILVDAYGSGAKPIIRGNSNGADHLVNMTNVDYWTVQNLELAYAGQGLVATYTTPNHYGLTFNNIYAHDLSACVQGAGTGCSGVYWSTSISVTSPFTLSAGQWVVDGVTISGLEAFNATAPSIYADCSGTHPCSPASYTNVVIKGCYFHDSNGGMSFQGVSNSKVFSNYITNQGLDAKTSGQTAFFLWHTTNILVANNIFSYEHHTSSPDETGIDVEAYNDQAKIRGNSFSNNAGAAIEYLALAGRAGDYSTNNEVSSNAFYNDGVPRAMPSIYWRNDTGEVMTGALTDNLYYETRGFAPGLPANWTNTNALAVASTDMFTSVDNFGSTQPIGNWTSRYYNGTTWQNFSTFDTTLWRWYQSSSYVSQFNMSPDNTNTWVARRWTAPRAGTIQIRGVLFKYNTGGDGVKAMIAKNNTGIWPGPTGQYSLGADDQVGTFTNVNSVTVAAGDTIDFELWNSTANATNDDTSWIPTIAYTS